MVNDGPAYESLIDQLVGWRNERVAAREAGVEPPHQHRPRQNEVTTDG